MASPAFPTTDDRRGSTTPVLQPLMVVVEAGASHTQRYLAEVTFLAGVFTSAIHVADPASLLRCVFARRDTNIHEYVFLVLLQSLRRVY